MGLHEEVQKPNIFWLKVFLTHGCFMGLNFLKFLFGCLGISLAEKIVGFYTDLCYET